MRLGQTLHTVVTRAAQAEAEALRERQAQQAKNRSTLEQEATQARAQRVRALAAEAQRRKQRKTAARAATRVVRVVVTRPGGGSATPQRPMQIGSSSMGTKPPPSPPGSAGRVRRAVAASVYPSTSAGVNGAARAAQVGSAALLARREHALVMREDVVAASEIMLRDARAAVAQVRDARQLKQAAVDLISDIDHREPLSQDGLSELERRRRRMANKERERAAASALSDCDSSGRGHFHFTRQPASAGGDASDAHDAYTDPAGADARATGERAVEQELSATLWAMDAEAEAEMQAELQAEEEACARAQTLEEEAAADAGFWTVEQDYWGELISAPGGDDGAADLSDGGFDSRSECSSSETYALNGPVASQHDGDALRRMIMERLGGSLETVLRIGDGAVEGVGAAAVPETTAEINPSR